MSLPFLPPSHDVPSDFGFTTSFDFINQQSGSTVEDLKNLDYSSKAYGKVSKLYTNRNWNALMGDPDIFESTKEEMIELDAKPSIRSKIRQQIRYFNRTFSGECDIPSELLASCLRESWDSMISELPPLEIGRLLWCKWQKKIWIFHPSGPILDSLSCHIIRNSFDIDSPTSSLIKIANVKLDAPIVGLQISNQVCPAFDFPLISVQLCVPQLAIFKISQRRTRRNEDIEDNDEEQNPQKRKGRYQSFWKVVLVEKLVFKSQIVHNCWANSTSHTGIAPSNILFVLTMDGSVYQWNGTNQIRCLRSANSVENLSSAIQSTYEESVYTDDDESAFRVDSRSRLLTSCSSSSILVLSSKAIVLINFEKSNSTQEILVQFYSTASNRSRRSEKRRTSGAQSKHGETSKKVTDKIEELKQSQEIPIISSTYEEKGGDEGKDAGEEHQPDLSSSSDFDVESSESSSISSSSRTPSDSSSTSEEDSDDNIDDNQHSLADGNHFAPMDLATFKMKSYQKHSQNSSFITGITRRLNEANLSLLRKTRPTLQLFFREVVCCAARFSNNPFRIILATTMRILLIDERDPSIPIHQWKHHLFPSSEIAKLPTAPFQPYAPHIITFTHLLSHLPNSFKFPEGNLDVSLITVSSKLASECFIVQDPTQTNPFQENMHKIMESILKEASVTSKAQFGGSQGTQIPKPDFKPLPGINWKLPGTSSSSHSANLGFDFHHSSFRESSPKLVGLPSMILEIPVSPQEDPSSLLGKIIQTSPKRKSYQEISSIGICLIPRVWKIVSDKPKPNHALPNVKSCILCIKADPRGNVYYQFLNFESDQLLMEGDEMLSDLEEEVVQTKQKKKQKNTHIEKNEPDSERESYNQHLNDDEENDASRDSSSKSSQSSPESTSSSSTYSSDSNEPSEEVSDTPNFDGSTNLRSYAKKGEPSKIEHTFHNCSFLSAALFDDEPLLKRCYASNSEKILLNHAISRIRNLHLGTALIQQSMETHEIASSGSSLDPLIFSYQAQFRSNEEKKAFWKAISLLIAEQVEVEVEQTVPNKSMDMPRVEPDSQLSAREKSEERPSKRKKVAEEETEEEESGRPVSGTHNIAVPEVLLIDEMNLKKETVLIYLQVAQRQNPTLSSGTTFYEKIARLVRFHLNSIEEEVLKKKGNVKTLREWMNYLMDIGIVHSLYFPMIVLRCLFAQLTIEGKLIYTRLPHLKFGSNIVSGSSWNVSSSINYSRSIPDPRLQFQLLSDDFDLFCANVETYSSSSSSYSLGSEHFIGPLTRPRGKPSVAADPLMDPPAASTPSRPLYSWNDASIAPLGQISADNVPSMSLSPGLSTLEPYASPNILATQEFIPSLSLNLPTPTMSSLPFVTSQDNSGQPKNNLSQNLAESQTSTDIEATQMSQILDLFTQQSIQLEKTFEELEKNRDQLEEAQKLRADERNAPNSHAQLMYLLYHKWKLYNLDTPSLVRSAQRGMRSSSDTAPQGGLPAQHPK